MPLQDGKKIFKAASGFLSEFRTFAIKGNAVELAVAVVVGGAFGKIVTSLVSDIIMPLTAYSTGGVEFQQLTFVLRAAQGEAAAVVLGYGAFLQTVFDFLVIAFAIFVVLKMLATARRRLFVEEEAGKVPPQEKPAQERLLEEIRDLLEVRR